MIEQAARVARQGFKLGWIEFSNAWTLQSWLLLWLLRMTFQAAMVALLEIGRAHV